MIRDNQGREFKGNSLIIKGLDNQAMKSLIITQDGAKVGFSGLPERGGWLNNNDILKEQRSSFSSVSTAYRCCHFVLVPTITSREKKSVCVTVCVCVCRGMISRLIC
jgi:hypothetical protein